MTKKKSLSSKIVPTLFAAGAVAMIASACGQKPSSNAQPTQDEVAAQADSIEKAKVEKLSDNTVIENNSTQQDYQLVFKRPLILPIENLTETQRTILFGDVGMKGYASICIVYGDGEYITSFTGNEESCDLSEARGQISDELVTSIEKKKDSAIFTVLVNDLPKSIQLSQEVYITAESPEVRNFEDGVQVRRKINTEFVPGMTESGLISMSVTTGYYSVEDKAVLELTKGIVDIRVGNIIHAVGKDRVMLVSRPAKTSQEDFEKQLKVILDDENKKKD